MAFQCGRKKLSTRSAHAKVTNHILLGITPALDPERADRIAALPLGSKLVVNPQDGHVELFRSKATDPALRESEELAVTPFMPYLKYVVEQPSETKRSKAISQPGGGRHSPPAVRTVPAAKKPPS